MFFLSNSSPDSRSGQGEHLGRRVELAFAPSRAVTRLRAFVALLWAAPAAKAGSWCAAVLTAVALLLTGPTSSEFRSWSASTDIDAAAGRDTTNEEQRSRLTNAVDCFADCTTSTLTDSAEEFEAESLPATAPHTRFQPNSGTSVSLWTLASAHEFFKPAEWLRAQHAPRGPPVS